MDIKNHCNQVVVDGTRAGGFRAQKVRNKKTMNYTFRFELLIVILIGAIFSIIHQNVVFKEGQPRLATLHDPIDLNGNTALDNYCEGNETDGLSWATAHVIKDYEITGGAPGLFYSSNIHIANTNRYLIIRNCTLNKGVYLEGAEHVKVENCSIDSTGCAICTNLCQDVIISGNELNGSNYGIWYRDTNTTQTLHNNLTNFNVGLWYQPITTSATRMKNHSISNNNFINNSLTVSLAGNLFTINSNHFINNSETDISIDNARNVTLFSNLMELGLEYTSSLSNPWWEYTAHNVSTTNLVRGKPLYYYSNQSGLSSANFTNAGQVMLVNCSDSDVSLLNIFGCSQAVWLAFSRNITVKDNQLFELGGAGVWLQGVNYTTVYNNSIIGSQQYGIVMRENSHSNNITCNNASGNRYGIYLYGGGNCQNNSISNNSLSSNSQEGIYVRSTQNNSIWNNTCSFNGYNGIRLGSFLARNNTFWNNLCVYNNLSGILLDAGSGGDFCGNNTFQGNNCSFNKEYGIFIRIGTNNTLWNNFLSNNTLAQAYDGWWSYNILQNQWDNLTVGNYWGDYQARYPSATNDGTIWGTHYTLGGYTGATDQFPLVIPQPLAITNLTDLDYECNTTGHLLSWTLIDSTVLGPTYAIYKDSTFLINKTWISGVPVEFNVSGNAIGTYNYTIIAEDGRGDRVEDQVNVAVFNAQPSLPTPPENLPIECNMTGTKIQWTIMDASRCAPSYVVYRNGSEQINQTWTSGVAIEYVVEGLPLGDYNFTLIAADGLGGVLVDEVIAFIRNFNPTIPSPPININYAVGTLNHNITWIVHDQSTFNPTYSIRRDGLEQENQTWTPEVPIVFLIDGLAAGDYTFSIFIADGLGSVIQDEVLVQVFIVNSAPVLSNPPDLNFDQGTTGYAIIWTISDETTSNPHYILYQNDVEIASSEWTPGQLVVLNIDGLAAGTYTFSIVFSDGLGETISDVVNVQVKGGDQYLLWLIIILIAIAIGGILIGLYFGRKRNSRKHEVQLISNTPPQKGTVLEKLVQKKKVEESKKEGEKIT